MVAMGNGGKGPSIISKAVGETVRAEGLEATAEKLVGAMVAVLLKKMGVLPNPVHAAEVGLRILGYARRLILGEAAGEWVVCWDDSTPIATEFCPGAAGFVLCRGPDAENDAIKTARALTIAAHENGSVRTAIAVPYEVLNEYMDERHEGGQ